MEHTKHKLNVLLKTPELLLLGIAGSLTAINLSLFWRYKDAVSFTLLFLFLATVYSHIKEKRYSLKLESGFTSSFFGLLILILVFINSIYRLNSGILMSFSPLISAFAMALIASGFKGLKQYWIELLTILFFSLRTWIPSIHSIDISPLTAKFSGLLLWYTGFNVTRSGLVLSLPTGSVEVYHGCSGIVLILDTLSLGILFLFMFDLTRTQKIFVPLVAALLGFIVNSIRVCIMAIVVAQGDEKAFKYWHDGDGSLVFSMIAAFIFCCFCWYLLSHNERKSLKI
jgi:cyanoexosortase A